MIRDLVFVDVSLEAGSDSRHLAPCPQFLSPGHQELFKLVRPTPDIESVHITRELLGLIDRQSSYVQFYFADLQTYIMSLFRSFFFLGNKCFPMSVTDLLSYLPNDSGIL